MKIDDMTFFHEGTVRICGSLDIDEALKNCYHFLKDHLPLELIQLAIFDAAIGGVWIVARQADFVLNHDLSEPIRLSAMAQARVKSSTGRIIFIDSSSSTTPSQEIGQTLGIGELAGIVLPLRIKKERLGVVAVLARGNVPFTSEHARLLELLHDPFAIAMSNHLLYREVVRLKEMLTDDNRYLHQELHRMAGEEIVGQNYGLAGVMEMVRQVAPLDSQVLLLGETGVGKEVIANVLHYLSPRRSGPLIKVNCGAIPEGLLDSELFGHEKGAFTGATAMKRGRFERADTGTIFLDEVGELPLAAQVRLLRVFQERKIERVGGSKPVPVDVRVIAATHRNLESMVQAGRFREDLWYRLNVFPITIPPLRQRKADIPAFVHHFIDRKTRELNLKHRPVLSREALERLQSYNWPGNVRELENAVERELIRHQVKDPDEPLRFMDTVKQAPNPLAQTVKWPESEFPDHLHLDEVVRAHILNVLEKTGGKVQGPEGAAALLGLNPSTLRHRMRKLGIPFGRQSQ